MSRATRKSAFAFAKTKAQISTFVFATQLLQSLFCLNPKFQVSSRLLWLYNLVCVAHGRTNPKTGFLMTRLKLKLKRQVLIQLKQQNYLEFRIKYE